MEKKIVIKEWSEFEAFLNNNEEARSNRFAQQAVSLYNRKGEISKQVISKARMAGFEFEAEEVEMTAEEARWIEIFNEMEALEASYKSLARGNAGHDIFGAASGRYTEDNSVHNKLSEINQKLEILSAERATLYEVEEKLYPRDAIGKHIKTWLC